jgi:hypothetical protein
VSSGLQAQRTELSWLRMTLTAWGVAVLAVRVDPAVAPLVLAGPVTVSVVAHTRRRRLAKAEVPPALTAAEALPVAVACTGTALAAVVLLR